MVLGQHQCVAIGADDSTVRPSVYSKNRAPVRSRLQSYGLGSPLRPDESTRPEISDCQSGCKQQASNSMELQHGPSCVIEANAGDGQIAQWRIHAIASRVEQRPGGLQQQIPRRGFSWLLLLA
eukprot:TRINITY_DN12497_c1_g1_i1.p4 TRINITY_DN12497_c1_g1~~TRINITY_DN12497_c1_g1_i1.p4  ORF type:complete len:123 (-),score=13.35 TRINITY_DN12497_c1_g1_i1:1372-1740(-)